MLAAPGMQEGGLRGVENRNIRATRVALSRATALTLAGQDAPNCPTVIGRPSVLTMAVPPYR